MFYTEWHKILRPKNLPNIMPLVTHSIEVPMCYKQNVRPYWTLEIFTGVAADCHEISVSFNKQCGFN